MACWTSRGRGRRCGGRGDPDARDQAAGSHAVEHAVDGQGVRANPENSPDMLAVEAEFMLNCLLSVN